jgi:hypothetical protein
LKKTGGFNGYLGIFICACSRINRQSPFSGYCSRQGRLRFFSPTFSGYSSRQSRLRFFSPTFSGYCVRHGWLRFFSPTFSGYCVRHGWLRRLLFLTPNKRMYFITLFYLPTQLNYTFKTRSPLPLPTKKARHPYSLGLASFLGITSLYPTPRMDSI